MEQQEQTELITLEQLLTEPKYRAMSVDELWVVIGDELLYDDYEELEGTLAIDKTRNLRAKWAKEESEKTCIPTELGAVSETPEPQPFSISQAMWEATQQNIAGLYIQIAKLNDKLEGKQ
jgi:hypothetical protein